MGHGSRPYTFSLAKGVWHDDSAVPPVKAKADGKDQPVKGHDYYDTVTVKAAGQESIELTGKKGGKVMFTNTFLVSPDGKTLTVKWSDTTAPETATGESVLERVAAAPAGAHPASGSWRAVKLQNLSASAKTVTYKSTPDGMSMTNPAGLSYTAKFDGKDVPLTGDPVGTTIAIHRVDDHTFTETSKRHSKVIEVDTLTASADGKSVKVDWHSLQTGRKGGYVMDKQ